MKRRATAATASKEGLSPNEWRSASSTFWNLKKATAFLPLASTASVRPLAMRLRMCASAERSRLPL